MNTAAIWLFAAALSQGALVQKDKVTLKKGSVLEGTVQKDTWRDVVVQTGAAPQTVRGDEVQKIEYADAPLAYRSAMAALEQEKWSDVVSALGSAEEFYNTPPKGVPKPRAWVPSYVAFYRGMCLMKLGKADDALKQFDRIRKEFKDSRFIASAFELTLEAYREKGLVEQMDAFDKEIDQAPPELRTALQSRAKLQKAEMLKDKAKYAEARALFEQIASSADPELAERGAAGVISCLSGLKDGSAIESYCKKILSTAQQPSLLLMAANALGDAQFDKKAWGEAKNHYIQSVVKYNPGRTGTGIEREHERAIFRLAQCYEQMYEGAKDAGAKHLFQVMASSAYREVTIEYPSGRYRDEATKQAVKLEPKEEKKDEKK